jgi:hypothetical protein
MLPQPRAQVGRKADVKPGVALRPQDVHVEHRVMLSERDRVRRSLLRGFLADGARSDEEDAVLQDLRELLE